MGKNCAIIVSAGKGTRMGLDINKQFLNIKDKPVLYYTLKAFEECILIDSIVLVMSSENIEYCRTNVIEKYGMKKISSIVSGGTERPDSVYNGLRAAGNCDIVLIHDGARPFVSHKIIEDGIRGAELYGASACGVKPKDTVKVIDSKGFSVSTPDRSTLFSVQTPQCFRYELILSCHEQLKEDNIAATDDTMVVERYGHKVFLYEGDYKNIKITTPEDIIIAESIVREYI